MAAEDPLCMSEPSASSLFVIAERLYCELCPILAQTFDSYTGGHLKGSDVLTKADGSFVTSLDQELDRAISAFLSRGICRELAAVVLSEETPHAWPPETPNCWLVDPCDGTHNFLMGKRAYGSMLALIRNRTVIFSAVFLPAQYAPSIGNLYTAIKGKGAWEIGAYGKRRPIHVSHKEHLERATVFFEGALRTESSAAAFLRFARAKKIRYRSGDSSSVAGVSVATGSDHELGPSAFIAWGNKPWDTIPIALLVEEAGGRISDPSGKPISSTNYADVIFSNGLVHDQILAEMRPINS